jgi:hypothetical protein
MTAEIVLNQLISFYKLCDADHCAYTADITKYIDQSILSFYDIVKRESINSRSLKMLGAVFMGDLILDKLKAKTRNQQSFSNAFLSDRSALMFGKIGSTPIFCDIHAQKKFIDRDKVWFRRAPVSMIEMPLSRMLG